MDGCTTLVTHSKVKVEENSRKAVFRNPQRLQYSVSKVDDCLVTSGVRTDYLVSEVGSASTLVELKGTDVEHAVEQLLTSAKHPRVSPLLEKKLGFLVICSRYPRFDTFIMKAKIRSSREFGAGFHVLTGRAEVDLAEVVRIDGSP